MSTSGRRPGTGLIFLAFVAFVALGMPDGLIGVAWPSIRAGFSIPLDAMGALLISGVAGYLASSFSSGFLASRLGVGRILAASCAITGVGLIGYTLVPQWEMMVLLGAFVGIGAGAIDSGLNSYAATHFHEGLMQWLHASYGIGVTLGPVVMTIALTTWNSWHYGYRSVGGFQLVLAICFVATLGMWNGRSMAKARGPEAAVKSGASLGETLRQPGVWMSAILFFLYIGIEVTLGAWTFTLLTESRGIAPAAAGLWSGSYWGMFTAGRVVAGLYARRLGVDLLIQVSFAAALAGTALLWWNPAKTANLAAIILIGLAIAPVFPALVSGTSGRVASRFVTNTIGMQMSAAAVGAAAIPGLMGVIARRISLEAIPASVGILFVALIGLHRLSLKVGSRETGRLRAGS